MQRNQNGGVTSKGESSEALGNASEVAAPQIVQQHPLSLEGRGVHPFEMAWRDGYWGLPEALAWIATRDLGIVAGVITRLKDGGGSDAEKIDAFLALVNAYPHYEPSDLDDIPADEVLRYALHQQQ